MGTLIWKIQESVARDFSEGIKYSICGFLGDGGSKGYQWKNQDMVPTALEEEADDDIDQELNNKRNCNEANMR